MQGTPTSFSHEAQTPRIFVQAQIGPSAAPDIRYAARIVGLRVLKCAEVLGYGATEEEAVRDLRRKVLLFLEMDAARRSRSEYES